MAAATPVAGRPSVARLFLTFGKIGVLSIGGGSSTMVLLQQEVLARCRWLTPRDFTFTLALSRMYPGVHLLAQAVLIGYLLRGLPGAVACSLGLLLPSSLLTIVFTLFFVQVTAHPAGAATMSTVLPATAGLALAVGYRLVREEVGGQRRQAQLVSLALIAASFVLLALLRVNSGVAVVLAGLAGVLLYHLVGGIHGPA